MRHAAPPLEDRNCQMHEYGERSNPNTVLIKTLRTASPPTSECFDYAPLYSENAMTKLKMTSDSMNAIPT